MEARQIYTDQDVDNLNFNPGSEFEDCEFSGIDFTQISLKSTSFLNCKFTNCNLANQSLLNVSFREINFDACNLLGVNWCILKRFSEVRFQDSKLNLGSFQGLKLKDLEIIKCSAIDTDFSGADLTGGDFSESNLAGANFNGAILNSADFRTSRDYLFDIRTTRIKGAKFSFPYVVSLITALGAEVDL